MSGPDDRTVHAAYRNMEIVRYDRSGKWYLEPTLPYLPRQHVGIATAVNSALWGVQNAYGIVNLGLPGGKAFDRKYAQALARLDATTAGQT